MKLLFIKNMEALKNESTERTSYEFLVETDAKVHGLFEFGPYTLREWDLSELEPGKSKALCLGFVEVKAEHIGYKDAKKNGFYHGGNVPDELIYLASLFLRRRLNIKYIVRCNDQPLMTTKNTRILDRPVLDGESNLGSMKKWFKLVCTLGEEYQLKFILAVKLYYQALLIVEKQPDLAYLNLISAIETLCHSIEVEKKIEDLNDKKLEDTISRIENPGVKKEMEQAILRREACIKKKFIKFMVENISDEFWKEDQPKAGRVEKSGICKILGKIYDQRSATLHDGKSFPPYIFESPFFGNESDMPLFDSISVGVRKWEYKDFIPFPHFFERLVRHVLINHLKKNQVSGIDGSRGTLMNI